jgi:hypothetical protein
MAPPPVFQPDVSFSFYIRQAFIHCKPLHNTFTQTNRALFIAQQMKCRAVDAARWVGTQRFMRTTAAAQTSLPTWGTTLLYAKISEAAHRVSDI